MNNQSVGSVHWSFWLITGFALLWNMGGSINYIMQMDIEFVASLPETHRAIIDNRPAWAKAGFAICVFGGVLACLLLLLRKQIALYVFIASLAGVVVTMIHTIKVASSSIHFSLSEIIVMIVLPLVVAAGLVLYTKQAKRKLWIS